MSKHSIPNSHAADVNFSSCDGVHNGTSFRCLTRSTAFNCETEAVQRAPRPPFLFFTTPPENTLTARTNHSLNLRRCLPYVRIYLAPFRLVALRRLTRAVAPAASVRPSGDRALASDGRRQEGSDCKCDRLSDGRRGETVPLFATRFLCLSVCIYVYIFEIAQSFLSCSVGSGPSRVAIRWHFTVSLFPAQPGSLSVSFSICLPVCLSVGGRVDAPQTPSPDELCCKCVHVGILKSGNEYLAWIIRLELTTISTSAIVCHVFTMQL